MTAPQFQRTDAAAGDGPMVEVARRWSATTPRAATSCTPCAGSTWRSPAASCWRSAAARGAARRRSSTSSAGSTCRPRAASSWTGTSISDLDEAGRGRRPPADGRVRVPDVRPDPDPSAAENVEVPLRMVGADPKARDRRVAELLELVGLEARAKHRPHELSGGEQQRVAIARALANRPRLLLADEPTGQLDSETGQKIMLLIRTVVRAEGVTAVVATHDPIDDRGRRPRDRAPRRRPHRADASPARGGRARAG